MIIVEVTPTTPEEDTPRVRPEIHPRYGVGMVLTGVDGSVWDLYDDGVKVQSGAQGFGPPKPEHRHKTSPALNGASWAGMRWTERTLTLPVNVVAADSLEWAELDAAFWSAISPEQECRLTVTKPDATYREILMRYDEGADAQLDVDPLLLRYSTYALAFIAADPFWFGQPIVREYQLGTAPELFPGPPFHIGASNVLGSATVTNPGDVEAWPVWEVLGPFTGFSIGLGDGTMSYTGTAAVGESIVVDMDPRQMTIRDGSGADKWGGVTAVNFAALPAGTDVPLSLALTGANSDTRIRVTFTPRYKRAW